MFTFQQIIDWLFGLPEQFIKVWSFLNVNMKGFHNVFGLHVYIPFDLTPLLILSAGGIIAILILHILHLINVITG